MKEAIDGDRESSYATGGFVSEETLKEIMLITMDNANYLLEDKVKKLNKLIEKIFEYRRHNGKNTKR